MLRTGQVTYELAAQGRGLKHPSPQQARVATRADVRHRRHLAILVSIVLLSASDCLAGCWLDRLSIRAEGEQRAHIRTDQQGVPGNSQAERFAFDAVFPDLSTACGFEGHHAVLAARKQRFAGQNERQAVIRLHHPVLLALYKIGCDQLRIGQQIRRCARNDHRGAALMRGNLLARVSLGVGDPTVLVSRSIENVLGIGDHDKAAATARQLPQSGTIRPAE